MTHRPNRYWNEETVMSELKVFVDKLGEFPTLKHLKDNNCGGLVTWCNQNGYKMEYFRNKFDMSRARFYWTEDKIIEKLQEIVEETGEFPTYQELTDRGLGGMGGYMQSHYPSINDWAEKLGYTSRQKPRNYWLDWENVKSEIEPLIINGKFPTREMCAYAEKGALAKAISSFGGIAKVAERMGYEPPYFLVASDGHYVNSAYEYILDEFLWSRGIEHEVNGEVPGSNYLYDFKIKGYYIEIWGFPTDRSDSKRCDRYAKVRKKKEKFYADNNLPLIGIEWNLYRKPFAKIEEYYEKLFGDLGFDVSLKQVDYSIKNSAKHSGYWNEEKVLDELRVFVEETGDIPTHGELVKTRADLTSAIGSHGGYVYFRKLLGLDLKMRERGSWTEEQITKEINDLIGKIGYFPSRDYFEKNNLADLAGAITRNGGFAKFQKLVNSSPPKKTSKYTEEEMVRLLTIVAQQLGKIPSYTEARAVNKALISAIDKRKIGYATIASKVEL